MLSRAVNNLLTFPDARGQRWSIWRPFWRAHPRWHRRLILLSLALFIASQAVRLGMLAYVFTLIEGPDFRSIPHEVAEARRKLLLGALWHILTLLATAAVLLV